MASVPTINSSNSELRAAARRMAFMAGMEMDTLESIVTKVTRLADGQRLRALLREPDNDDGGTG